jgi:hypothetical protein
VCPAAIRVNHFCIDNDVENIGNYKIGDHVQLKLSGGRIVQATIKVVVETTGGVRLQVSFGGRQR